jgi:GNAT superfamily N-acetyltransferase
MTKDHPITLETQNNLVILPFHPDNQVEVQNLINEGLGEHWGKVDKEKNPDLKDISNSYRSGIFLVAWLDDEIVGTGALVPRSRKIAEIVRMSVDPIVRRQGIGRALLEALTKFAMVNGYQELILETTATWNGVIDFYLSFGFQTTHLEQGNQFFKLDV